MSIFLLGLKKVERLWIVIISLNCIIHRVAKHFFNISDWLLRLLSLSIFAKKQYKTLIIL